MQKMSKTNQSVQKTLQIIETMASAREPMRLADIALQLQMPASTTLRMVSTLVLQGYAYQEQNTLRYGLTLKLTQIGSQVNAQLSIRDIAHPILVNLSQDYNESACLAIEEDMEVIYIDVVDGPDGLLKITQCIGKRAPMHSTGVGKLMLTQYSTERLALLTDRKGLMSLTPNTVSSLEDLHKELDVIRQRGYALDDEECEIGARCVAAPVRNFEGKIVAAISLSGPISRVNLKRVTEVVPSLLSAADEISSVLAHHKS